MVAPHPCHRHSPSPLPDGIEVLRALAVLGPGGIAAAISQLRTRAGLTASELAMLVGVDPATVDWWEHDLLVVPKLHHLFRLGTLAHHQPPPHG